MAKNMIQELKDVQQLKSRRRNIFLIFLCLLTGMIAGGIVVLYTVLLEKSSHLRNSFFEEITPLRMITGLAVFILLGLAVQFMLEKYPLIGGSGIPQVSGLLQKKIKFNWFPELITKFFGGVLAIGTGMSMGREGPSIHLGALVGEGIKKIFRMSEVEEKYLVTCGASAGISAAFNAPLAGTVFALEELHKFFSPLLLICVLVASGSANYVLRLILGSETTFQYNFIQPKTTSPIFTLIITVVFALVITISGKAFSFFLVYFQKKYKNIKMNKYLRISVFMVIPFLIAVFFKDVTGGGHQLIVRMFKENSALKILFLILFIKFFYTMLCYGTGFPGGIFFPMLVIGALIGKIYGEILYTYFSVSPEFIVHFMLLGMAAYFTAVVRAPITGIILILEMTGNFSYLFMLIIVVTMTYVLTELFKMEPIYETLFENMFADKKAETENSGEESRIVTLLIHVGMNSEFENKKIKELKLPKTLLIVSVRANGKETIPDGETVLKSGNQLVIITTYKTASEYASKLKDDAARIV